MIVARAAAAGRLPPSSRDAMRYDVTSVRVYSSIEGGNQQSAAAVATILLVIALAAIIVFDLIQRRLTRRVHERNEVLAFELAILRGSPGRRDLLWAQTVQFLFAVHNDGGGVIALQNRLPKLRRQRRNLLVERGELLLVRIGEIRALAHEQSVIAL